MVEDAEWSGGADHPRVFTTRTRVIPDGTSVALHPVMHVSKRLTAAFACAALAGCMGFVGDPGAGPGGGSGSGPERTPGFTPIPTCPDDADTVTAEPLRRLTRRELERTFRDLLGDALFSEVELEVGAIPEDAPWAAEGIESLSFAHVEALVSVANRLGEVLAVGDGVAWRALSGECMAAAEADEACVRGFIEDFGLRAFRRPLSDAEHDDLYAFYAAAGEHSEGAQRLVMRMLLSPSLLFHLEIDGAVEADRLALDDFVVANRIAYRVLGTMPTAELLDAAARGELSTPAGVEAQVRALLTSDEARAHVIEFFEDWLRLDAVQPAPAHLAERHGFDAEALETAMRDDVESLLTHGLFDAGMSYRELLTTRSVFPRDDALAEIYGTSTWSEGAAPLEAGPERAGLLTRAALLAHKDTRVAPIQRGVFLRRRVLCDVLPSPDPEIVNSRLEELDTLDPAEVSSREQIELITAPEGCQTCHRLINGLAFPLEEYDALGRFRTQEEVYDESGTLVATHEIDPTATIVLGEDETVEVASAAELVDLLAESDKVAACLARTVYEYTRRRPATADDQCGVARLSRLAADDVPLTEIVVQNAATPDVLYRRLEE